VKCPYCKYTESKVLYTIYVSSKKDTVRRRHCLGCDRRFTTEEIVRALDKKAQDAKKQLA
jgi:transcriptional repressor NrdR